MDSHTTPQLTPSDQDAGEMPTTLVPLDTALYQQSKGWKEVAETLVCTNADQYREVVAHLAGVKTLIDKWREHYKARIAKASKDLDDLRAELKSWIDPLLKAEVDGKKIGVDWYKAEEVRKAAEERVRQDLANEQMETNRLNVAAALELEGNKSGNVQLVQHAERLIATIPVNAPVMPVESRVPKVAGASIRQGAWKARLTAEPDAMMKLIRFVASHPEYVALLELNEGPADKLAAGFKSNLRIDGLEAYQEDPNMAISRKRALR